MAISSSLPPISKFKTEQLIPNEVQVLQQTLAKVILGTANSIETYDSVLVLKEPPTIKRVHVISDKQQIINIFHQGRNGASFSSFLNSSFIESIGTNNLVLCPIEQHRSLRSPIEMPFRPREVAKHFEAQVSRLLQLFELNLYSKSSIRFFVEKSLLEDLFGLDSGSEFYSYLTGEYEGDGEELSPTQMITKIDVSTLKKTGILYLILYSDELTQEQKFSTILALYRVGPIETSNFINAFHTLLLVNPSYRTKIQSEWIQFIATYGLATHTLEDFTQAFKLFVLGGDLEDKWISPSAWLQASYREASRLFPATAVIRRLAQNNLTLDGKIILKDDLVDLDILSANRNARTWTWEPEKFLPERFFQDGVLIPEEPMINFGMGHQGCIGKHLAKQEALIYVGLQTILYDLTIPEEQLKKSIFRMDHNGLELSSKENLEMVLKRNARHPAILILNM